MNITSVERNLNQERLKKLSDMYAKPVIEKLNVSEIEKILNSELISICVINTESRSPTSDG
tara:strand:- start:298 stop:480 length:183 start_codon:yes stop_codon:yes gene_type:complete